MSAPTVAAPKAAAAPTAARPATTRVTILTGKRMTDLVLPAAAPMESYIDDTVSMLAELLDETPADVLAGFDFSAQGLWAFARPGSPPLKLDQSLNEAGVVDGSLLTLVSVSRTERHRPLVEDVIDAIAVLDESPEFDRAALHLFIGAAIPAVIAGVTWIAIDAVMDTWWNGWQTLYWSIGLGVLGIVLLAGAWISKKFFDNVHLSLGMMLAAFIPIAVGVALAVPPPTGATHLGAPQFAAGSAAVLLLTLLTRGGPRRRAEVAAFSVITMIAITAAAMAYGYGWERWVPAGAVAFGLFVVTNAAKLTVAVARIALPPIPAPGENVENEELLDAVAANETSAEETQTWQAIIASVPKSAVRLTERSRLAKQLLTGFLTAGALILAAGAIAVVVPGHFFVHSLVVAGLATSVCGFRSRLFAERWCAWALLAATAVIPTGIAIKLSHWYPHYAWMTFGIYLGAAVVALAIVGAMGKARRMSPVMKRILELVDGATIAAIIPLLLWITSVYDMVRNLRF